MVKKSPFPAEGIYTHKDELSDYTYTAYNSFALACILQAGAFLHFPEKIFGNPAFVSGVLKILVLRAYERGNHHPLSRLRKEVIP